MTIDAARQLADVKCAPTNLAATISRGSFRTDGIIIAPCSARMLAAIAGGVTDTLLSRAVDVVLKEGRKLVLVVHASPLNAIHLENMLKLARLGVAILPSVSAFYNHPATLDDMIKHVVALAFPGARRWDGRLRSLTPKPVEAAIEEEL